MQSTSKRPINFKIKTDELQSFAKKFRLTEREMDVFFLLASKTINSTDLGKQLGVSHHTVSNHLKNIFQKTNTGNKAELLAMFICDLLVRGKDLRETESPVMIHAIATSEAV